MKKLILFFLILTSCGRNVPISTPNQSWFNCTDITKDNSREAQSCQLVMSEITKANEIYLSKLGELPSFNWTSLYYHAGKIDHIDSRGVPVKDSGAGNHNQADYDSVTKIIFYANPYAIHCEALHALRLASGNEDWKIIGHNTSDDPLHYDCSQNAVETYLLNK